MYDYTSRGELDVLCDAIVRRGGLLSTGRVNRFCSKATHGQGRLSQVELGQGGEGEPEDIFPLRVRVFINRLVEKRSDDLGNYWLVDRLFSLLVKSEALRPGEVTMLRVDIEMRLPVCGFSDEETFVVADRFKEILKSLSQLRPAVPARGANSVG